MSITIAFDVYGTLIDTNGVVDKLTETLGDIAPSFANTWREKQLEYSFRRGLMQNYEHFGICTQQALDYTCLFYEVDMSQSQKLALFDIYKSLPAFGDVIDALIELKNNGHRLYAFSNGNEVAVEGLLNAANIRDYFLGVVSVDPLQTFKPNPAVYNHFLNETNTPKDQAWLISSNPFDVLGALSVGMSAAWVKRSDKAIFDPWGLEPTITINSLVQLNAGISKIH
ncbi:MAG: 2-haloacid dehalogenase [Cocleimonas sp.]|jgi:2-haloacid dehalogenase